MRRVIGLLSLLLGLLGCTPEPEKNMQRYMQRLANVMNVEAEPLPASQLYPIPAKRVLAREATQMTVGLLESYQLRHCGLLQLVSERNSILGKVADPFRQYAYQMAFIDVAQRCVLSSELDTSLAEQIQTAIDVKQQELMPIHFSNLVWTSNAMRKQFSQQHWIEAQDIDNSALLISALNVLQMLSETENKQQHRHQLIQAQETIEKLPLVGSLLFSMENSIKQLTRLNQLINQHQHKIGCGKQRDTTQYRYMKNVFEQQYRQRIQPYLAEINQLYYRLAPVTAFLNQKTLSHQTNLEAIHLQFQSSIKNHVLAWKRLFERCEGTQLKLGNR
ncbi:DUF3080 family protein [Vibrio hippocampi]|uniref:DUF3080 domain-containing protein n=1 Tax=Vibrio hippocampi TaxID=654686 RepID=A0ABM8ZHS9_9VIBR|nr:DUF3080 family protein [Vibrio hippocampi]CAH0526024.1 hypothetical protein VHP8226_01508 [Vibrio hippocampi]